ncbi:MBOAT family O-acyltransferase [Pedobacter psychroterrae]|uniref:MBOAT family O-acyltransferase n=1 Tax=Pedobacter psychroterrae TaxID=2530453 RepID=UPI0013F16622|nr:MBOAT family protein [Pedobacter psychroterrae]
MKQQNLLILIGSYVFYAWWDWRFLLLLAASTAFNYYLGIHIKKAETFTRRRFLLYLGLLQALGTLLYFKYFNFFIESFTRGFSAFDLNIDVHLVNIILPLGISFYTFRTVSYIIDIYNGKTQPTTNWVIFFAYVAFFPTLISGPIDRVGLLIPQFETKRVFNYENAVDGMRQILWGFFKKMVVANNCALIANPVFDRYHDLPASTLVLGAFFYTIQIYADFSGYTDMATGFSRLLGFNITKNFNYPFFARNIADYWRRWHMSLTSWVTDYVFLPLTIRFRDYGKIGLVMAIMINLIVVGIWHGANWTFILYGVLHGLYFIPLIIKGTMNKKKKAGIASSFQSFSELKNILLTFLLVMFTNVVFRARNITEAFNYYMSLFSKTIIAKPVLATDATIVITTIVCIVVMLSIEWIHREKSYGFQIGYFKKPVLRWALYLVLITSIFCFSPAEGSQFIYFQF